MNLRRTRAYIRLRKRVRRRAAARRKALAPQAHRVNHELVVFDQRELTLPTATLLAREPGARARVSAHALVTWLAARWSWVNVRRVPLLAAACGMVFVMMSADYLAHQHGVGQHHVPAFRAP